MILSYKTSQTCSEQCGITQGFPCGGSGTPDVQQNSFLGNPDRERGKNSPVHILSGTWHLCVSFRNCSPLRSPYLSPCYTKTNPLREILSGAERGQANAKNLGTEKPRVLPVFPITCSRQENTAGINILLPGANCKMVCAGTF